MSEKPMGLEEARQLLQALRHKHHLDETGARQGGPAPLGKLLQHDLGPTLERLRRAQAELPPLPPPPDPGVCPYGKCGGRGWYVEAGELVAPCRCIEEGWRQTRVLNQLKAAQIPPAMQGASFDTFEVDADNKDAFLLVTDYLETWPERRSAGDGFGLIGPTGVGKTHLLIACCQELLRRGVDVRYIRMVNAFGEMQRGYSRDDAPHPEDLVLALQTVEFLALDDLGADEELTAWERKKLLAILDYRYNANLPTAFTSNHRLGQLAALLGDRLASRLLGPARGRIGSVDGPDRRIERE